MSRFRMRTGLILLMGTGLLWGTIGISGRMIFERSDLNAFQVSWLRTMFAMPFCMLVGYRLLGRQLFRIPPRDFAWVAALAIVIFGSQATYLVGVDQVGVAVATLVCLCSIPVMVTTWSVLVQGESMNAPVLAALVAAVIGTAMVALSEGGSEGNGSVLLGVGAALLAAAAGSFYNLGSRSFVQRYHPITALALGFPVNLIVFLPVMRGVDFGDISLTVWLLLFYLGVGTQGIAYMFFQWGLQTESATIASIMSLLEPVTAALLAWAIFGERLGPIGLAGAALLIFGLILLTLGTRGPTHSVDYEGSS